MSALGPTTLGNRHPLLLVEDDDNDVVLIRRAFAKSKIANTLEVVTDGEAAIAYLAGEAPYENRVLPELVLLDLKLPRKSGHEVLEWIRSQPGLLSLPVVVLTSSRESSDLERAYRSGANSYLVKPPEFEALLEMVRTLDFYWMVLNQKPGVGARGA
ncbi:MAG: response regulator [Gemmatimonadota bacterium]